MLNVVQFFSFRDTFSQTFASDCSACVAQGAADVNALRSCGSFVDQTVRSAMANATAPDKSTRRSIKERSAQTGQQKRRDEALQRQQAARQDFADHARQLATLASESPVDGARDQVLVTSGTTLVVDRCFRSAVTICSLMARCCMLQNVSTSGRCEDSGTAMEGMAYTSTHAETSKQYYARQLMQPEWLTDIPADMCTNWCEVSFPF